MSDMGINWQEPGEDELILQYMQMMGGLPGDTPAQRMNYMQDIVSSMKTFGVDPRNLFFPSEGEPVAPFVEPINATERMYAGDPLYASIFQAIEDGMSPIQAAKAARDQGLWKPTDATTSSQQFNDEVVSIAQAYARDRVAGDQARAQWQAEAAQAEQGRPSALAYTTEFDAMGAPTTESLMDQYMQRMGRLKVGNPNGGPATYASAQGGTRRQPGANATGNRRTGDAEFWRDLAATNAAVRNEVQGSAGPMSPAPWVTDAGQRVAAADQRGNAANQRFNEKMDRLARQSIERRVNQAKNTKIRSEENRRAAGVITALAAMLQGGFPE